MKKITTLLTLLAASASLALAQDATPAPSASPGENHHGPGGGERPRMDPEARFKKLDTNGDGFLSLEEFKAAPMAQKDPVRAEARFKELDTNGDGKLSLEELKAGRRPHGPGAKGSHKGDSAVQPAASVPPQ